MRLNAVLKLKGIINFTSDNWDSRLIGKNRDRTYSIPLNKMCMKHKSIKISTMKAKFWKNGASNLMQNYQTTLFLLADKDKEKANFRFKTRNKTFRNHVTATRTAPINRNYELGYKHRAIEACIWCSASEMTANAGMFLLNACKHLMRLMDLPNILLLTNVTSDIWDTLDLCLCAY